MGEMMMSELLTLHIIVDKKLVLFYLFQGGSNCLLFFVCERENFRTRSDFQAWNWSVLMAVLPFQGNPSPYVFSALKSKICTVLLHSNKPDPFLSSIASILKTKPVTHIIFYCTKKKKQEKSGKIMWSRFWLNTKNRKIQLYSFF